ncbi:MAG TPA: serine/threonine-protein kinase [Rhizomicrobium sp.]|nr:serine/threonine-protein kinase [Rhizomicrobium sp.]
MNGPYHNKALPGGTVLREWRLEQVLGVGGFGIVYRGRGVYFDELVAIKEYFPGAISDRLDGTTVAPTDSSAEETYQLGLQKFVEEAKVLWNLSKPERHPNIVCVRSLFEIHGTAYMVMDFERGVSLSQMLKDGRTFDDNSLLDLIRPIADGLDRAHKGGVLHRDIKPANILVTDDGRPVLIDFGSARFDSGQATSTKVTFYTPPYAAIEQYVKTYPQGPWTDIYALGVVLYQCVTGEKPPEVLERLHGGLGESLASREWPGFSRAFAQAVDAAMAIRPSERPQSIPEWLRMFESDGLASDEDATRITVATTLSSLAPAVAESAPVAPLTAKNDVSVPTQNRRNDTQAVAPASASPARIPVSVIVAGGAALLAVALAAYLLAPAHRAMPAAKTVQKPIALKAKVPTASLGAEFDALIAKAQDAHRPAREIDTLDDAKVRLVALSDKIIALSAKPGATARAKPLIDQLNVSVHDMAADEGEALARSIKRQWKDFQDPDAVGTSGDAAAAVAAVRAAKDKLDGAVSAAANATTAAAAVEAVRDAVIAYDDFETRYGTATQYLIPAKKNAFVALDTASRALSEKIVTLAAGAQKPWLFASRARKDAYQQLQDDAAKAKEQIVTLDGLSRTTAASSNIKQIETNLGEASTIKQSLNRLLTSSNAAATQLAQ